MNSEKLKEWQGSLKNLLPPQDFIRWLAPLVVSQTTDETIILAPTIFHLRQVKDHYQNLLLESLNSWGLARSKISYHVNSAQPFPKTEVLIEHFKTEPLPGVAPGEQLNPAQDFSSFIKGPANQLALAALADESFPLVFIWATGPFGKSHLLNALGLKLLGEDRPHLIFGPRLWVELEEKRPDFWLKKQAELFAFNSTVIIDDVHLLKDYPQSQNVLTLLMDQAAAGRLRTIMSSPQLPYEMTGLSEALRSRLNGSLLVRLENPDYDLALKIFQAEANLSGVSVSEKHLELLFRYHKSDLRCLQGALKTLNFMARQNTKNFDPEEVILKYYAPKNIKDSEKKDIEMAVILNKVAEAFNLKSTDLTGNSKSKQISWGRRVVMYLAQDLTALKTKEIGQLLGGRDHSTVVHGLKKIKGELNNQTQARVVENIKATILNSLL